MSLPLVTLHLNLKKERRFQNIDAVKRQKLNTIKLMFCTTLYVAVLQTIRMIFLRVKNLVKFVFEQPTQEVDP